MIKTLYPETIPAHPMHPRADEFVVAETPDKGRALTSLVGWPAQATMARFDGLTTNMLTQHSLQMRPGEFILDTQFIGMLAHSCDPNVKLDMVNHLMVSLKPIEPGDVLSMDYASTEADLYACFECSCGASNCRKIITGYDQDVPSSMIGKLVVPPADYRGIEWGGTRYYGQHLMVSGYACNDYLLDIPTMKKFISDLADAIGMVRFGPAHVYRFGNGHEVGLSGFQLIETSQVSFHSNDAHRDIYLDVFSCREFSEDEVVSFLQHRLSPARLDSNLVWRR